MMMRKQRQKASQLELKERRKFRRRRLGGLAWIFDPADRQEYQCTLVDISVSGAAIELSSNYALSESLLTRLDKEDIAIDCRLAWRSKTKAGIEFS